VGLKLNEFRLKTYAERAVLSTALQLYQARYAPHGSERTTLKTLLQRLSRTECQPGGCPYCNADRAREQNARVD
jgi:hypothetical protein